MGVRGCGIIQTSMNEGVVPTKLLAAFRATHSGIFLHEDDMSSVDSPLPCHTVYFFSCQADNYLPNMYKIESEECFRDLHSHPFMNSRILIQSPCLKVVFREMRVNTLSYSCACCSTS